MLPNSLGAILIGCPSFPAAWSPHITPHAFEDFIPPVPITRRRLLGFLTGAAAVIGVPTVWISRMKTYDGPISDHFDGERFFDRDGAPPRSLNEVLRWQFSERNRATWPEWIANEHADTPPPRVDGNKVRFSFVGHASWLIQTAGLNILVDPVWSMRVSPVSFAGPKRHNDPGIAFDALPPTTLIFLLRPLSTNRTGPPKNFEPRKTDFAGAM